MTDKSQSDTDAAKIRVARLAHDHNGRTLGVGVFLAPADLQALGIDPDTADAVVYRITEGQLSLIGQREYNR